MCQTAYSAQHDMTESFSWPQRIAALDRGGERDIKGCCEVGDGHERDHTYAATWLLLQLGERDLGFSMGALQLTLH